MKASALLTRGMHQPPPALSLGEEVGFALSRVHEICGASRRSLAVQIAARLPGTAPVIWVLPSHSRDRLNPRALCRLSQGSDGAPGLDPGRLLFVAPTQQADLLWTMEEVLKDGTVPLVVTELDALPGMTPVRRLHLAAEAGARLGPCRPLGLLLTAGAGGAPGVESRWSLAPDHAPGRIGWRLDRLRARMLPPRSWAWTGTQASPLPSPLHRHDTEDAGDIAMPLSASPPASPQAGSAPIRQAS